MGLIRGRGWWWRFFKELLFDLHTVVRGHITLGYGKHEIDIPLDEEIKPLSVYLNCFDDGVPVCVGDVSLVAAHLHKNGFTLYADVKANTCTIKWLVEYEPNID